MQRMPGISTGFNKRNEWKWWGFFCVKTEMKRFFFASNKVQQKYSHHPLCVFFFSFHNILNDAICMADTSTSFFIPHVIIVL